MVKTRAFAMMRTRSMSILRAGMRTAGRFPCCFPAKPLAGKNFSLPKRRILNYVSDFDYFFECGCDFFPDFPCRHCRIAVRLLLRGGKTGEFKTGRAPPPHAEVGPQSSQSSSNLHSISLARAVTAASA